MKDFSDIYKIEVTPDKDNPATMFISVNEIITHSFHGDTVEVENFEWSIEHSLDKILPGIIDFCVGHYMVNDGEAFFKKERKNYIRKKAREQAIYDKEYIDQMKRLEEHNAVGM